MSVLDSRVSNTRASADLPPAYQAQNPRRSAVTIQDESQISDGRVTDDTPPAYHSQGPVIGVAPSLPDGRFQYTSYHVYRTSFGNYKILHENKTPKFYVKTQKLRDPDLIIHSGTGDYDREVASCKFPQYGGLVEMDLFRKVNNRSSVERTRMTGDGRFSVKSSFVDAAEATSSTQRAFAWRTPGSMLIDEEKNQMVACMQGVAYGLTKCFVLEIQASYGKRIEVLTLCSAMAMYESERREETSSASDSGHRRRRRAGAASAMMGANEGSAGAPGI